MYPMRELTEMELDAVSGGRTRQTIAFVSQRNKAVFVKSAFIVNVQVNNVENEN
jgi:hypothetical protein